MKDMGVGALKTFRVTKFVKKKSFRVVTLVTIPILRQHFKHRHPDRGTFDFFLKTSHHFQVTQLHTNNTYIPRNILSKHL